MGNGHRNDKHAPRRTSDGDRAPVLTTEGIRDFTVTEAIDAAQGAKAAAVRDILLTADRSEMERVARWLRSVLDGASPDDIAAIRT
ncbi:MAG: hypothetical protein MUE34_03105, partial [Acidimicrobiales bacterium]|nr:hypothetical protein [Acidimicrobiales bacterium]